MAREELTRNLKKYIAIKKKIEETDDEDLEDRLGEKLEELYFYLDEDEISWLEINEIE